MAYGRSCLVTLGLVCIGVSVFVWITQGSTFSKWPVWSSLVFLALPILGFVLIGVGLFVDRSKIKGWAEGLLGAELGGIIIMILALPIFLVMSVFGKRESDR